MLYLGMKRPETYIPVSCDFIDQVEIQATQGSEIELVYLDETEQVVTVHTRLKTWETKDKVEYLITDDQLRIRLDRVKSINDFINEGGCSF
jgi:transcriptional antiterminator Rof (Rho-off)